MTIGSSRWSTGEAAERSARLHAFTLCLSRRERRQRFPPDFFILPEARSTDDGPLISPPFRDGGLAVVLPLWAFGFGELALAQQPASIIQQPYLLNSGLLSRSISFENPTAAPGNGGKAASELGVGRKGAALPDDQAGRDRAALRHRGARHDPSPVDHHRGKAGQFAVW